MIAFAGAEKQREHRKRITPFALEHIHRKHMPTIYKPIYLNQLFKEAHLQQLSIDLVHFENRLDPDDTRIRDCEFEELKSLRRHYIFARSNFTNDKISSQLQGNELHALMQRQFDNDQTWELLGRKIETL